MSDTFSESISFEPPEQENIRLREENARLRRLLAAHSIPIPQVVPDAPPTANAAASLTEPGVREQEWIRLHWREHLGSWVVLDGSLLIAKAARPREAVEIARAVGISEPFLVHVTEPSELPFGGW